MYAAHVFRFRSRVLALAGADPGFSGHPLNETAGVAGRGSAAVSDLGAAPPDVDPCAGLDGICACSPGKYGSYRGGILINERGDAGSRRITNYGELRDTLFAASRQLGIPFCVIVTASRLTLAQSVRLQTRLQTITFGRAAFGYPLQ